MNIVETLKGAREKLLDPTCWTQKAYGRDADGDEVHARAPTACCWCLSGAIYSVTTDDTVACAALDVLGEAIRRKCCAGWTVIGFNDFRTTRHEDVLRVLDEVIELAETLQIVSDSFRTVLGKSRLGE